MPSQNRSKSKKKSPRKPITILRPLIFEGGDYDLWANERTRLFKELRRYSIPSEIIDAVEGLGWHRRVRWINAMGKEPKDGELATFILEPRKKLRPTPLDKDNHAAALKSFDAAFESESPANAGEVLAGCLTTQLKLLAGGSSPVRRGGRLSKATIALAAFTLLEDQMDYPPGPQLLELLRQLLDVKFPTQEDARHFHARAVAAQIFAQDPERSLRMVAKNVGVNAVTVSRWMKEDGFLKEIKRYQDVFSSPLPERKLSKI